MQPDFTKLADVASASAAMLFSYLRVWRDLPDPELFRNLRDHLEAAILAWEECKSGWRHPIEPSRN
jgi:hypothetical protein